MIKGWRHECNAAAAVTPEGGEETKKKTHMHACTHTKKEINRQTVY